MKRHAGKVIASGALALTLSGCDNAANMGVGVTADMAVRPDPERPDLASGGLGLKSVNHIVVIYLENHSFDNLYGEFEGAENLAAARQSPRQVDAMGVVYATLPQPVDTSKKPAAPDTRFPANLPNAPFNIDAYLPATMNPPDLVHRYYQQQAQIDGGKMDRFAAVSDAAGLTMGYYHTAELPLATEAKRYTLCDHFFQGAFGGSFLNHVWLVASFTPSFPNAPASMVAQLDMNGNLVKDGAVTPGGEVVNTAFTVNTPHPANYDPAKLVPNQTMPTIGDRLTAAQVSWAWYSGGWNDALAGKPDPSFQFHHQPFAYFANYADGTQGRKDHLKDEADFMAAAAAGTLPAVSFVKPLGMENEHPGYANLIEGEKHTLGYIDAVRNGPAWKDTVIIVTWDENGGFWDHVSPPAGDKWGPGARVPTLVISPFAKKGYVDHTVYDTLSILALIEHRYALAPLGPRDGNAADLTATLDFSPR